MTILRIHNSQLHASPITLYRLTNAYIIATSPTTYAPNYTIFVTKWKQMTPKCKWGSLNLVKFNKWITTRFNEIIRQIQLYDVTV